MPGDLGVCKHLSVHIILGANGSACKRFGVRTNVPTAANNCAGSDAFTETKEETRVSVVAQGARLQDCLRPEKPRGKEKWSRFQPCHRRGALPAPRAPGKAEVGRADGCGRVFSGLPSTCSSRPGVFTQHSCARSPIVSHAPSPCCRHGEVGTLPTSPSARSLLNLPSPRATDPDQRHRETAKVPAFLPSASSR